jgi:hypothetical protein
MADLLACAPDPMEGEVGGDGGGSGGEQRRRRRPVLYVSGEESVEQIGSRAERMGIGASEGVYLFRRARRASPGPGGRHSCHSFFACSLRPAVRLIPRRQPWK